MAEEAAKALYRAVAGGGEAPPFGEEAQRVLDALKALSRALYSWYEAADNEGDDDLADRLDALLTRITILRISIGQALQRYIDDAPDTAAALAALDEINGRLDRAADRTARQSGDLKTTAATLDQLAKLAGWVEAHAGG